MKNIKGFIFLATILFFGSHAFADDIPIYIYEIINAHPHDKEAFTQGLVFAGGYLYEGTGQYGSSTLHKVELEAGKVLQIYKLPPQFFGEGITIYKHHIIQYNVAIADRFCVQQEKLQHHTGVSLFD